MASLTEPTARTPTARTAALRLLGLPASATEPQIVHAYRRLVRATHPEATGSTDPCAAQKFAAIHDAYQLLTQPGQDPVEPVKGSRPQGPGDESATSAAQPPPASGRWAPRSRPPIIAGPVLVTPLPPRGGSHPRSSR